MPAEWRRAGDHAVTAVRIPQQEVAAIVERAAAIGIPAWRVMTALGVPHAGGQAPDDAGGRAKRAS